MKTFGKFLVDKDIITQRQAIEAYKLQEEKSPKLVSFLMSFEQVDDAKLLEMISSSINDGKHLLSVLNESDPGLYQAVQQEIKKEVFGIRDCLIELGFCDRDTLENEYKEFCHSNVEDQAVEATDKKSEESESSQMSAAALESLRELGMDTSELEVEEVVEPQSDMSEAALESLRELGMDTSELETSAPSEDPINYELEYLNFFDNKRFEKVNDIAEKIGDELDNTGDAQNFMTSLFQELHLLKGAACLDELKISGKLLDQAEKKVSSLIEIDQKKNVEELRSNVSHISKAIEVVWDIRESLSHGAKEIDFWHNDEHKKIYLKTMRDLNLTAKVEKAA